MAPQVQMYHYQAVVRNTFIDLVEQTSTKEPRRARAFTSDSCCFPHGKETREPLFHIAYSDPEPESEPTNRHVNQEPGQQLLMMLQQQEQGHQEVDVPQQQLQQLQQLQRQQMQQRQQQQQERQQPETMLVDTSSGVPICYAVCFVAPETAGFTPGFDPCQQSQPMDQQQQQQQQQQYDQQQQGLHQWQEQEQQQQQQQQQWQSEFQQQEQQQEQWHSRTHHRQQHHQQLPWQSQQQQQQYQRRQNQQQPQGLQLRQWQGAPQQQQPFQNRRREFQREAQQLLQQQLPATPQQQQQQHQDKQQCNEHEQQQLKDKEEMLNAVPEHLRTTVMLRNIPNGYSSEMLKEMLDMNGFQGEYDFLYVPMDFRSGMNIGYAFVNGLNPTVAGRLRSVFEGFDRWAVASPKVCQVSWSRPQQGFAEHVERYRNSPVMHESVPMQFKPRIFQNGEEVPFPLPTAFIRPVKVRTHETPKPFKISA